MPSNGTASHGTKVFDLQALLTSISSAGIIGCLVFAWNTNSAMVRTQEKLEQEIRRRDEDRITMNQMQLDIRDLRDRAIRLERIQSQPQKSPL